MNDRKNKLLNQKNKLEEQAKKIQGKLKVINQELENIELQEKAKSVDEIVNKLKEQGVDNIETLLNYVKQGKINIK